MIIQGVMVNTGPWSNVSTGEKNQLNKQLPKLAMLRKPISGSCFQKIDDNATIIFFNRIMERTCRNIDWGILCPLDFIFEETDNLAPPAFVLTPDMDYLDYFGMIYIPQLEIRAAYQGKCCYRVKMLEDRYIVMFPLLSMAKGDDI